MDYEKAYKETFNVAKCLHEACDATTKKQMERLFPQLVESDDERNLKKVKRAIRIFFTNPTESDELLTWLEKQKECVADSSKTSADEDERMWSEEDEGELQNAIDALEFLGKKGVYKSESGYDAALQDASWLKSLPERFNLQPKQEWSEEDEQWLESIIREYERRLFVDKDHAAVIQIKIDFLKSLRNRPKPSDTWKPSEEQMNALNEIINTLAESKHPHESDYLFNMLNGLRKNLKKL